MQQENEKVKKITENIWQNTTENVFQRLHSNYALKAAVFFFFKITLIEHYKN